MSLSPCLCVRAYDSIVDEVWLPPTGVSLYPVTPPKKKKAEHFYSMYPQLNPRSTCIGLISSFTWQAQKHGHGVFVCVCLPSESHRLMSNAVDLPINYIIYPTAVFRQACLRATSFLLSQAAKSNLGNNLCLRATTSDNAHAKTGSRCRWRGSVPLRPTDRREREHINVIWDQQGVLLDDIMAHESTMWRSSSWSTRWWD